MDTRSDEPIRRTRDGRLAQGMARVRERLGLKQAPAAGESAAGADTEPRPVSPPAAGYFSNVLGTVGAARRFLKARLKTGGRPLYVPPETIAPPSGQWIEGVHANDYGSRAYKLYVPGSANGEPLPLLVMLHGCTQDPDDFAAGTRMNFLAEAGNFLVVYPAQAEEKNPKRCWSWFDLGDQHRDRGEPAILAGITRQIMSEYKVDAARVYVAGMSAGAAMAAVMAATYPDLYAAVGVHSGPVPGGAYDVMSAFQVMKRGAASAADRLVAPVPLILFHGDQDHTVHPCNAEHLVEGWAAQVVGGASAAMSRLEVTHDGSGSGREYTRTVYEDHAGRTVVERWNVHGAGHAWSGGSRNGSYTFPAGPDASREMVRFFLEHPQKR